METTAVTLADNLMTVHGLLELYNNGEVCASLEGEIDNTFFQLGYEFLDSVRIEQPDGSVALDYSLARMDLLREMDKYKLSLTKRMTDNKPHLKVVK
jgi:hypothetical protein